MPNGLNILSLSSDVIKSSLFVWKPGGSCLDNSLMMSSGLSKQSVIVGKMNR